ncbi:MAG TPA: peptidoglycan editing factor PgeF [Clostridium sp.]|nr:polyphenol oxidase [Clostridium sp. Bc-iso-3]HHV29711.1 peptidoglycan editing factor PgeF [Clostridium sp.]
MDNRFESNKNITYKSKNQVEFIQFNNLLKYENVITHCFTTRRGGVSEGQYESLNMAFNKTDDRRNVEENYKRVASALNLDIESMVFSNQVHQNRIRVVTEEDRGKGIIRESDIIGYDGLVTNSKEVTLVTFYADCVPVFLFDPEKTVISIAHSGWRGTAMGISKEAVGKMKEVFSCEPRNIVAAVGPSIGKCCFEVGDEVYDEFKSKIEWSTEYCDRKDKKWHFDLKAIIKKTLLDEGVREENIVFSEICTKCNKDIFFSHRGDNGKTGTMAGIMKVNG